MNKRRVVVVCPGRGAYGPKELGTVQRYYEEPGGEHARLKIEAADALRSRADRATISALDGEPRFSASMHMAGENASALTYVLSVADHLRRIADHYEIAGVVGNSLGWYTSLYVAGVLGFEEVLSIVETTGAFQARGAVGGQLIYPVCDEDWWRDQALEDAIQAALTAGQEAGQAYLSIDLGGLVALAGDAAGVAAMHKRLPPMSRGRTSYPMRLVGHSAFHTPLMGPMASHCQERLSALHWQLPRHTLIDGRGHMWRPLTSSTEGLRSYTLGTQITDPYDFAGSVRVALRELAPEALVLLGPGSQLAGALGQIIAQEGWRGVRCKEHFKQAQADDLPLVRVDA